MKFAFADPPYIGQAKKHYSDDPRCAEVDHNALLDRLCSNYDGWALSASSTTLKEIMAMSHFPDEYHIGVWVKPFASYKPNVNPAYAWEPVIFSGGRERGRNLPTIPDFVIANITLQTGTHGAKPESFCYWLFEMLGMGRDDQFDDLFPGSGNVTRAWESWRKQVQLWEAPARIAA